MTVSFKDAGINDLVASTEATFGLAILRRVQVQVNAVLFDGFPREEALYFFAQCGHHILIGRYESEHIAIDARRSATGIENALCGLNCVILRIIGFVGLAVFQNNKPNILFVAHIHGAVRAYMNAAKGTILANRLQATLNFHLDFFLRPLAGAILDGLAQRGAGIIPEAVVGGIAVQVGQAGLQCIESIIERCNVLSRLYHAKANAGRLQSAHSLAAFAGRRTQHNRAGHAACSHVFAKTGIFPILDIGNRIGTIYLVIDDGVPVIAYMAGQFIANRGNV